MASQFEALPTEVLDAVLRATALSAPQAARLLPRVCRAFRASAARIAASTAPFATLLAVSCSESRALLLLRLRLLPPSDAGAPAAALGAHLLARYDVADLGSAEAEHAQRSADPHNGAWPTYVARLGPRGVENAHTTLLLSEYARSGLMLLRASVAPDGAARLTCDGVITHPRLEFPEGLACAGGHVYVASVGEQERRCVVAQLAPPLAPSSTASGLPLSGAPQPRVLAHRVMPDILGNGVSATPWDVALGPATDPDALFIALHTNADVEDEVQYTSRTGFPTGGVWRLPLSGRGFGGRAAWAVPPDGVLCRPSAVAFSRCGTLAYVATFLTPDCLCADADADAHAHADADAGCDPRGVVAFRLLPTTGPNRRCGRGGPPAWARLAAWDVAACARAGLHPWALAVDGGTGALLVTAHGGWGGHVIAQLCPATGAVRATWRHAALAGAPNSLALL